MMRGDVSTKRTRLGTLVFATLALLLVAAFLGQAFSTLATTAPTYDEVAHLPAGYAELMTGKAIFNPEHPPLAKLIAAAALWPDGGEEGDLPSGWQQLDEWRFGQVFLFAPGRDTQAIMTRARRGPIMIGLLLCLVCCGWSTRLYGAAGGLFTLALCVFSPTLLAHTRLVTTDVPVGAFGVLTAALTWELMNKATLWRCLLVGLALGATLASKFTGLVFIPALGAAVAISLWRRWGQDWGEMPTGRITLAALLVAGAATAVVGLSYGWPPSVGAYLRGMDAVGANTQAGFQPLLLGQFTEGRFPLYFPIAFLLKTSPAVLLALAVLVAVPLLRRKALLRPVVVHGADVRWFLWIPPIVYAAAIVARAPDIGVRYLIPIYPFLFVSMGLVGAALWSARAGKVLVLGLVALHIRSAAQAWPDPISYFNGLLGCRGPAAVRCLDNADFDWGQDLARVGDVINPMRRPDEQVVLLYFGTALPAGYVPNGRYMQDDDLSHPRPQLYVVSLSELQRMVHFLGNGGLNDWQQRFRPVATVGNTYFVYDFRPQSARLKSSQTGGQRP